MKITSRVRNLVRESPSISRQPPRSGDQKRKNGDKQANDHGSGDRLVRLAPDNPRSSAGKQEDGGDRASQQRAEVHPEPAPTSCCKALAGWFAPVVRDETWDPPGVGEDMDSDQREPDQDTEAVQGKEWASRTWAGHHESDPATDDHESRGDEQRSHNPQRQVGWTSAYESGRSSVVAQEAPSGAAELDDERAGKTHPDKDVDGQPRAQDRRAHQFHQDQHEEHRTGQRSHSFVADHRGLLVTVAFGRLGLSRWAHEAVVTWLSQFHGSSPCRLRVDILTPEHYGAHHDKADHPQQRHEQSSSVALRRSRTDSGRHG